LTIHDISWASDNIEVSNFKDWLLYLVSFFGGDMFNKSILEVFWLGNAKSFLEDF
jgi:hypothetical protein